MRYLLPLITITLAGCAATSSSETRSLLCLGFCTEQRSEHTLTPAEPRWQPRNMGQQQEPQTTNQGAAK